MIQAGGGIERKLQYAHNHMGFYLICSMCGAESPAMKGRMAVLDAADGEFWKVKKSQPFCPEHSNEDIMKFLERVK